MRNILIAIFIILLSTTLSAQKNRKIEKQLNKLFEKGKYEKCHKKALKYNKKHPEFEISKYYISKVCLRYYSELPRHHRNRYKQLKKSVSYSIKLTDKYQDWKIDVQDSLKLFVFLLYDSVPNSRTFTTASKFYTRTYNDTLYFDIIDESTTQIPIYEFTNSTIDSLRYELIRFAEKQDGIRYRYAGEKPETGFDCSGFTKYVYGHIGIDLPHNAQKQSELDGNNKELADAEPGDLIFFGYKSDTSYRTVHAAIVYSVNENDISVIHCVSGGVSIDGPNLSWELHWKDRVLFVKTLPVFSAQLQR